MMMRVTTLLTGLLLAVFAHAERIDNFVLLDQHGDAHNLYYHKDKSAIVVMIQGNGCPIVRNALTDYKALRDQYADQGVHFLMLNSNLQDQRSTIFAEAEKYGIDMPILHDESQLIGESLNLIRTAEVLIIDPKTWNIVYRGPINDRQVYERQKAQASNHFAADAIANVLAGEPIDVANRDTMGCLITLRSVTKITQRLATPTPSRPCCRRSAWYVIPKEASARGRCPATKWSEVSHQ